ncbi:UvrD-helicase domain-containing protein, partial [Candidatus Desantisbacteria bacterium]|nr:UvrD-helicase domain-containing protein [Candidatus Desantisbacteria bacterium]
MLNLNCLNPVQKEAVETIDGPLLILAGAGSGKTRVITYRIAYLIKEIGIHPQEILSVTFTNKAAGEMRERVISLLDGEGRNIWISTFHSACVRILHSNIERLGYKRNFVIYSAYEQEKLFKEVIKKLNITDSDLPISRIASKVSRAKNNLITCEEFGKLETNDFNDEKISKIYTQYQKRLKENNAMDFDDLIMQTVLLLNNNEDIRHHYQERFRYIMVDEYQDTNMAQYIFLKLLSGKYKNICVVGDDDQSIYGWRGADVANILNFEKDFPGAKIVRLEQNYRSTATILKAANCIIKNNKKRKGKNLWTDNSEGENITFYIGDNEIAEAYFVAGKIFSFVKNESMNWRDFAIFYRTHAQSRVLEDNLRRENIPYII